MSLINRNPANLGKTIQLLQSALPAAKAQTSTLSHSFKSQDIKDLARQIHQYCRKNYKYKNDPEGLELIRLPNDSLKASKSGIDCEDYVLIIAGILSNKSITFYYKIVDYGDGFQHIYVVVKGSNGKYLVIDPVAEEFNFELVYVRFLSVHPSNLNGLGVLPSVASLVKKNAGVLRKLEKSELKQWAVSQGIDHRSGMQNFKRALTSIGVDFEAAGRSGKSIDLQSYTHKLTLSVSASFKKNRFAITDVDGNVLWHGIFLSLEKVTNQDRAEYVAASKAVWLAGKVMEDASIKILELQLINSNEKAVEPTELGKMAAGMGIKLFYNRVQAAANNSSRYLAELGYKRWDENYLKDLAKPIFTIEEVRPEKQPIKVIKYGKPEVKQVTAIEIENSKAQAQRIRILKIKYKYHTKLQK